MKKLLRKQQLCHQSARSTLHLPLVRAFVAVFYYDTCVVVRNTLVVGFLFNVEAVEAKAAAQEEIVAAAAPVSTTKAWSGVLPSGWYAVYDENYHAYYYANMRTV